MATAMKLVPDANGDKLTRDELTREERQLFAALCTLLLVVLMLVVAGIENLSRAGASWFFNQP